MDSVFAQHLVPVTRGAFPQASFRMLMRLLWLQDGLSPYPVCLSVCLHFIIPWHVQTYVNVLQKMNFRLRPLKPDSCGITQTKRPSLVDSPDNQNFLNCSPDGQERHRASFPDNDESSLVRSFSRWILRTIANFFGAFPETPLNMNARSLHSRRS